MKATSWMGAGLLALPLHLAWANGDRSVVEPGSAGGEVAVQAPLGPIAPPAEPEPGTLSATPPAPRLRDSLRQSGDNAGEPFQPYRLSLEERQRMREQLRHHGTIEFRLKP